MKLRGFVLAMASLAMQFIFIVLAVESDFAGGALGTQGVPKFAIFGISFANDIGILLRGVGDRVHLRRHRPQRRSFAHRTCA